MRHIERLMAHCIVLCMIEDYQNLTGRYHITSQLAFINHSSRVFAEIPSRKIDILVICPPKSTQQMSGRANGRSLYSYYHAKLTAYNDK